MPCPLWKPKEPLRATKPEQEPLPATNHNHNQTTTEVRALTNPAMQEGVPLVHLQVTEVPLLLRLVTVPHLLVEAMGRLLRPPVGTAEDIPNLKRATIPWPSKAFNDTTTAENGLSKGKERFVFE